MDANVIDITTGKVVEAVEAVEEKIEEVGQKKKKKDKKNSISLIDAGILCAAYGTFKVLDLVVNGDVNEIGTKIKKSIAKSKENRHFIKFGWRDASKEEAENAVSAEPITNPPAIIDVPESDTVKINFTVNQEEESNKYMNNHELNTLIKKYNYSDKLLATAILWLCDKIDQAQVGAVISNSDPEGTAFDKIVYINCITMYFADKRFATNPMYTDIEFNVTPDDLEKIIRDLSALDIMKGNEVLSDIITKTKEYIAKRSNKAVIIFDNSKLDLNVSNCPKETVAKIEGAFGDLLSGYTHTMNKLPEGLVELFVTKSETQTARYLVDPGVIFAGEVKFMVADTNGSDYFTSDKDIIKKVIDMDYRLTSQEAMEMLIKEHQFLKQNLLLVYDFTLINSKLKDMEQQDITNLEAKLNYIILEIADKFKVVPRMKIKNYKSIDSFVVVSNGKIPSPLDEMSKQVVEGLTIKVKGDEYIIELRDENGNMINTATVSMDFSVCVQSLYENMSIETMRKAQTMIQAQKLVN